ncbi:hypothetical protein DZC73_27855 [Albitalea terrae]|uniref:Uncharacterized protein n=1 Tax=Piscinibacter terrae TaxID=2496871 RepID=A0A3N7HH16_9BURK|nr:hypothetical protein DZC73_27855 [Albitalea terrae]
MLTEPSGESLGLLRQNLTKAKEAACPVAAAAGAVSPGRSVEAQRQLLTAFDAAERILSLAQAARQRRA